MQYDSRAFTLIETIVATGILAFAAAAVASLFISTVQTEMKNRDRSTAAILVSDKIGELAAVNAPVDGVDYVSFSSNGNPTVSATDSSFPFKRVWQIVGAQSKTVTVVVYDRKNTELLRSSTVVAPRW